MLASSPALLDGITLRRLLDGRRRMFDSDSANSNLSSLRDSSRPLRIRRNFSGLLGRPRASANDDTLPLSQRKARGAIPKQKWPGAGLAFVEGARSPRVRTTSSKARPPPARTLARPAGPAGTRSAVKSPHDYNDNPHLTKPSALGSAQLRDQAAKLQTQFDEETKKHYGTQMELQREREAYKSEQAFWDRERAEWKKKVNDLEQEHERKIQSQTAKYDAKVQQLARKHDVELRNSRDVAYAQVAQEQAAATADLEKRRKQVEALGRDLTSEVDALKLAKSNAEKARIGLAQGSRRELAEEMASLRAELTGKAVKRREKDMSLMDARFAEELRQLQAAGASRLRERENYASYRRVWVKLGDETKELSAHLERFERLIDTRSAYWRQALRDFKPENIDAWFSTRYAKITRSIHEMLASKIEEARQADDSITRQLEQLAQAQALVRTSGHSSRFLTRQLRFEAQENRTAHRSIEICSDFLKARPLQKYRDELNREQRDLERVRLSPAARREHAEHERKLRKNKARRSLMISLLSALSSERDLDTLRAVARSPPRAQDLYRQSRPIETAVQAAVTAWSAYTRGRDGENKFRRERSSAHGAYHEAQVKLREETRAFKRAVRMRQLLQEKSNEPIDIAAHKEALDAETLQKEAAVRAIWASITDMKLHAPSTLSTSRSTLTPASRRVPSLTFYGGRAGRVRVAITTKPRDVTAKTDVPAKVKPSKTPSRKAGPRRTRGRPSAAAKSAEDASAQKQADDSPPSERSSSNTVGGLKATAASQAAHIYWPSFPRRRLLTLCVEDLSRSRSNCAMSTLVAHGVSNASDGNILSGESDDVQSSASSYQPSEQSVLEEPFASSAVNPDSESSAREVLPSPQFGIPDADFKSAVLASPNTSAAYWNYKLYKDSEGKSPLNYYCTNLEQAELRAKEFLNEPVIGFDIEWDIGHVPSKSPAKRCVSLIQIAADDKIALFHLGVFKGDTTAELMPASLRQILESREIVKAGVNIQGDAKRMSECLDVKMTGIFELSHLYRVVMFSDTPSQINRKPFKLATQVQEVLLLPLRKDAVRTSAWSKKLDAQQSDYAASDAYAGFRLFHALEAKRMSMDPMPPRPAFWEEHKPIQLGDGTLIEAKSRPRTGPKKGIEEDDDEDEEFFDAVETQDPYGLDQAASPAGVPLGGLSVTYPTLPALDDHQLETSMAKLNISPTSEARPAEKPARIKGPPPSEQVEKAEEWVAQWRASLPDEHNAKAPHYQLRAYALWQPQSLACHEVAALLRKEPLSLTTVASYVLEAVKHEGLQYDAERLAKLLNILGPTTVQMRYGKIAREVGWSQ